jgi:predicted house-cleaning noncanonical NTP pyrophosphatase (MazG superfamily)
MEIKEYNKLVRDNIPEIIEKDGEKPITHIAEDEEYEKALMEKLQEEVNEFLTEPSKKEMADVLEVLYAIAKLKGFDLDEVEKVRQERTEKRGGFEKKIILERTEKE